MKKLYRKRKLFSSWSSNVHVSLQTVSRCSTLSNEHTDQECRQESSAAFIQTREDQTPSLSAPSSPLPIPSKHCAHSSMNFQHSSAPGEWVRFSLHFHLYTDINNTFLFCHCLLCSQSVALFLFSFFYSLTHFLLSCSQFSGKCDSTVTLISDSKNLSCLLFSFITNVPPLFCPWSGSLLSSKRSLQISFLSEMFLFYSKSTPHLKKIKPCLLSIFAWRDWKDNQFPSTASLTVQDFPTDSSCPVKVGGSLQEED